MLTILHIITGLLFVYCSLAVLYFLIFSIAGKLYRSATYPPASPRKNIAILIPAYRENEIIYDTVKAAVQHPYPPAHFRVFVAADQLFPETVDRLRTTGAVVHTVQFRNSTKARSLNALLNSIPDGQYDIALILDADNIMAAGALEQVNSAFQAGFQAVQLHRKAKNEQNSIALLDGISEAINNHIFRKGHRALGLSSHTIGSGMAFDFQQLKAIYNNPHILDNPACDREVDLGFVRKGIAIEFIEDAMVLDEKVSDLQVFQRQRTRWMESQLSTIKLFLKTPATLRSIDFWNKFFGLFLPPRILLLGIFPLMLIVYAAGKWMSDVNWVYPPLPWFAVLFTAYCIALLIALPSRYFTAKTLKAFLALTPLFLMYLRALFKLKPTRKEFLHTPKSYKNER